MAFLKGVYPSVTLYCNAAMGFSSNIFAEISLIASTGNASGAGFPAESDTTDGSAAYLKISLIADGLRVCTLSEMIYSM